MDGPKWSTLALRGPAGPHPRLRRGGPGRKAGAAVAILTPGCAEIRIKGTNANMPWVCVMHAIDPGLPVPIPAGDLNNLLTALSGGTAWQTAWAATLISGSGGGTIDEVSVRDVGAAGSISSVAALSVVGTNSGACQNGASAAVAEGNIGAVYGFKKPPKIFFPAVPDAYSVANELTSTAITNYGTIAADLRSAINGAAGLTGPWQQVLRSLYFGSGGGTPDHPVPHPRDHGITTPVLSWVIRPKVGTRVDRLRGGRRHR